MELTDESRSLFADLFGQRDQTTVAMDKGELDEDCIKMLEDLEKKTIIKNLNLGDNKKTGKMDVILQTGFSFDVISWEKMDDYGMQEWRSFVSEPFGFNKQVDVVKKIIIEKTRKLDNPEVTLQRKDLSFDFDHIQIFDVIDALVEKGFLEQISGRYYLHDFNFEIKIRLKDGIPPVEKPSKPIPQTKTEIVECKRQFRFKDGVLFKDHCDEVLVIKKEDSHQHRLLAISFDLGHDERIDAMSDDLEMSWRQIYDTARNLNEKIQGKFAIDPFFEIDSTNKWIKRIVE